MLPSIHVGHLLLPVTGLTAALGLVAALLLSLRTAPRCGVDPNALWTAGLFAAAAAFLLSRLLLVAADPRSFLAHPLLLLALPSLTATGILSSALATILFLRVRRVPLRPALDAWAAPLALLWLALACGDFMARTDPGLPTTLPWGVRPSPSSAPEQPVALFAALAALALLCFALRQISSSRPFPPGTLAALTLLFGGTAQFLLSFVREPLLAIFTPTPLIEPLQWLSLCAVTAGAVLFLTRQPADPHAVLSAEPHSFTQSHAL